MTSAAPESATDAALVADAVNAVRFLAVDAVQKANSGHPGAPLGLAPLAYALFTRHIRHDPAHPDWPDRDRFVLSAGHASMLQYATMHLCGYDVTIDDLRSFRQWKSRTPGHPERGEAVGVEITTGPLGQGLANAVGMAIAERQLAARFSVTTPAVVDHRTWVIAGDGDIMEGVASEASSIAGFDGLGKLTVFYDDNKVTLSGPIDKSMHEDVAARYRAYGWHVTELPDVNDQDDIDRAVAECLAETDRPSLVVVNSHIGFGSPLQDSYKAHGAPLGDDGIAATRERLGWTHSPFDVPKAVLDHWHGLVAQRAAARHDWEEACRALDAHDPALFAEYERCTAGELPEGWDSDLPTFAPGDKPMPTRKAGNIAINTFAGRVPELTGGSADLDPSTLTVIDGSPEFGRPADGGTRHWDGRNVEFGVREHAMGAIVNGMAAHGGVRPYGATFFVFSDYMRPAIRLAALMGLPSIFVFTHDSVGVGEDGPTHQPVEHLASLRAIPELEVIRPADPNETIQAWACAIGRTDGPTALVLTRQNVPILDPSVCDVAKGATVVADTDGEPDVILVGTGSEVGTALGARDLLATEGISARVVSMPSWRRFRAQPRSYRDTVLPQHVPSVGVEAGVTMGWSEFVDTIVGIDRFGGSGPGDIVLTELGISAQNVAVRARELLAAPDNAAR